MTRLLSNALLLTLSALPLRAQSLLATIEGDDPDDRLRSAVGGHDLDGDSWHDLVVGFPFDDTSDVDAGVVRAYSGRTGAVIWSRYGDSADRLLGHEMTAIFDSSGDGVPELAVTAPNRNYMRVLDGSTGQVLYTFYYGPPDEDFGRCIASGFHWNNDVIPDFAVGVPDADYAGADSGSILVFDGATHVEIVRVDGGSAGDRFGSALGCADVVDTFWKPVDLIVGAPYADGFGVIPDAGLVRVYGSGVWQATVTGNRVNGRLGSSIARAADLDGDGFDEFLLGEPGFDPGGAPSTGRVRLIRGISFQLLATLEGDAGSDHFGRSLGSLEDLDRDGFEDFVVGAFFADGYARVFSSWTQTELFTVTGGFRDGFGEHLASAGDFDNDGTWDLAVVAPFYDGAARARQRRPVRVLGRLPRAGALLLGRRLRQRLQGGAHGHRHAERFGVRRFRGRRDGRGGREGRPLLLRVERPAGRAVGQRNELPVRHPSGQTRRPAERHRQRRRLHPDKTRLIRFGRFAAEDRQRRGEGKPETFDFLGFTHICGKTSRGAFQVIRRTMRRRLRNKLRAVKAELRRRMHDPVPDVGNWLKSVVDGHANYYGVPNNGAAVEALRNQVVILWHKALSRQAKRETSTGGGCTASPNAGCPHPASVTPGPSNACASSPEAGTQCGKTARWDLHGGYPARGIPTVKRRAGRSVRDLTH